MRIQSILTKELTFAQMDIVSKKRLLDTVAQAIAEPSENIDATELLTSLITREKLGSTGIGNGIAIPHCRFATIDTAIGVCMTLAKPIDFDAIDQAPVDIVFAMVVPEDTDSNHLKTLASLAEALQDTAFVAKLRKAKTANELFEIATS